ncbi:MAG: hypothetical protein RLZZ618_3489 [Pseudomonadota bacterium]|jgi:catecholate siderophore receptor
MAHIKSRKHAPVLTLNPATAALAVLAMPMAAFAQAAAAPAASASAPAAAATPAAAPAAPATLPAVRVKAAPVQNNYKADTSSSPKFTQPLVNTTQTITIIKKEILAEQGATTLSEALGNTPGITFQMGENGNTQTGDSVFMRGFDTQGSIFVDGIRDLGTISRDVFNVEQIEVVKGPAGADIGRGSPTGYINLNSKTANLDDASSGSVTVGSGHKRRLTADVNRSLPSLGDGTAIRLNVMKQDNGVTGRDHVSNEGFGFAPSLAFGLNSPTRVIMNYLHVEQSGIPDGGIPAIGISGFNNNALTPNAAAVDRSNFYGSLSDYNRVRADMFTTKFEHDLKPGVTLRNTSRLGRTEQRYVLTGINSTVVTTTPPGGVAGVPANPANWLVARSRQGKNQENLVLTNQTNLTADFETAGLKHSSTSGIEFIHEKQNNVTLGAQTGTTTAPANLYRPNPGDSFAPVVPTGAWAKGATTTVAAYVFDTLKITEAIQINGGVRWEKYKTEYNAVTLTSGVANPALNLSKSDNLLTWKLGALYKPAPNGSIYAAYGTSQKPPGSDSFALSTSGINTPNLDPSEATNIELGTKWELFDNRLALTAAVYRAQTKNDTIEPASATLIEQAQVGKKTVQGLELGAAGMITKEWQVNLGLGLMDTEINATNSGNAVQQGQSLAWSPKLSFTSWTTYRLPFGLTVGGGARFVKSQVRNSNPATAVAVGVPEVPSYWVFDALAAYEVSKNVSLQFNMKNLADKFYVQSLNSGGSRYTLGAPRTSTLTANVKF